ncbi:SDR family NAD(P)-dependent oxidoreductase [Pseudoalteromonas fenneropenaei]|uniref:SDR family NAD(P)-dependent oxidoreductase n=1 Tax=Pseudoalteromonas fenneropenaei TaxID=1737459 RepID=A0ABV7CFF6_9GAMM
MAQPLSIIITGCSSGIGLYCAEALHRMGHKVVATARQEQDVAALQVKGLLSVKLDLSGETQRQAGFNAALALLDGKLDVLFNNGAYGQPGAVEDLPTAALKQQFEVNLFAWHELTNLALKIMLQQGHGRIIHNSSVLGLVALPYRGAYNASKFALEGLTDTLRMELKGTGVQVSLIEPGPIVSKFRENARQAFLRHIDWQQSRHHKEYQGQMERLAATDAPQKFTLGPEAVLKVLLHAIHAKQAKARYYVTFPTYLMGFLRRILPTKWLDKVLLGNR